MKITWQGYEFEWIQGGLGVIKENISGHVHSKNSYELHYIVEGKGILITDGDEISLTEGYFFITGYGVYHEQKTDKDTPLTEVHCYLQSSGKKTKDMLVNVFLEHPFYIKKNKGLKKYFLKIAEEVENKYVGYESIVNSCLNYVLTEYTRSIIGDYKRTNLTNVLDTNDRRFLQIEEEFINNVENITLSSLAERIGFCERQTQRLLQKYYGMTFTEIKKSLQNKKRYQ